MEKNRLACSQIEKKKVPLVVLGDGEENNEMLFEESYGNFKKLFVFGV